MLFILCVRLAIKVKVGMPESLKVGWYPPKKTGSSHLNTKRLESNEARIPTNVYYLKRKALLRGKRRHDAT